MYKYIHTCIYIHISCPHTYAHTHINTHAYKMYIWTHAKHVWNDGAAATARTAQLDTKKLCPSPCPHHDSAPFRLHPLICTGAEPIHPVHCPRQLPAWPCRPMAPRNGVIFLPFWRGFCYIVANCICDLLLITTDDTWKVLTFHCCYSFFVTRWYMFSRGTLHWPSRCLYILCKRKK